MWKRKLWGIIGAAWTAIVAFVSWYLTGLSLKKEIRKLKEDLSEAIKKSSQQYTIQAPDSGLPNVEFHLEYEDQEVFYHKKKSTYYMFMRPKAKFVWPDGREKNIEPIKYEEVFTEDRIAFLVALKRHNAEKEERLIELKEDY